MASAKRLLKWADLKCFSIQEWDARFMNDFSNHGTWKVYVSSKVMGWSYESIYWHLCSSKVFAFNPQYISASLYFIQRTSSYLMLIYLYQYVNDRTLLLKIDLQSIKDYIKIENRRQSAPTEEFIDCPGKSLKYV